MCLAVSEVHSIIVSGSHDLTCILWDLEELSYITQLAGHTTIVSALAINDLTVSPPSGSPSFHCSVSPALFLLSFEFFGSLSSRCSSSLISQHEEGRVLTVNSMNILFVCVLLLFVPSFCLYVCTPEHQHYVNMSKGEIVSCAGPQLYLWTMKGQLLTCTDTSCGPQSNILCISFTQRHEWDSRNVIITGCEDGIIRVSFVLVFSCR